MKSKIKEIVRSVSKQYDGGEEYFTAVDDMIKNNKELMTSFINRIISNNKIIVSSGGFGQKVLELKNNHMINNDVDLIVFNGSIRKGKTPSIIYSSDDIEKYKNKHVVYADDSFYSGKTIQGIEDVLKNYGIEINKIFVMYDGCNKRYSNVESLYRYYA